MKSYNTTKSWGQESNALLGMKTGTIIYVDRVVVSVSLIEILELYSCIFVIGRRVEDVSFFLEI